MKKKKGFWKTWLDDSYPTYSVDIICINCGQYSTIDEVCGKLLTQKKLDEELCSDCECRKVFRRNFVQLGDTDNKSSANGAAGTAGLILAGR